MYQIKKLQEQGSWIINIKHILCKFNNKMLYEIFLLFLLILLTSQVTIKSHFSSRPPLPEPHHHRLRLQTHSQISETLHARFAQSTHTVLSDILGWDSNTLQHYAIQDIGNYQIEDISIFSNALLNSTYAQPAVPSQGKRGFTSVQENDQPNQFGAKVGSSRNLFQIPKTADGSNSEGFILEDGEAESQGHPSKTRGT